MRKLLLATTALVGLAFAGSAQAAESPVAVTVGGYVDFTAAMFHESAKATGVSSDASTSADFETEYQIDLEASGQASNGVEYGAKVGLWNGNYDGDTSLREHDAYLWLAGDFGKAVFGDHHSASVDMFVTAPTVGAGQIDGNFSDFVSSYTHFDPSFLDNDENGTKVTYYTPKVGTADHKVQLGVSYEPNYDEDGSVTSLTASSQGAYKNVTGAAVQYMGQMGGVSATASATMNIGVANDGYTVNSTAYSLRDFATYSLGAQASYAGVTVGASYVDAGHVNTIKGQGKAQDAFTIGASYGFDNVEVAAQMESARGYANDASAGTAAYVRKSTEYGVGAVYTWFPGMTTAADLVFFDQKKVSDDANTSEVGDRNQGHVFLVSQKLAF